MTSLNSGFKLWLWIMAARVVERDVLLLVMYNDESNADFNKLFRLAKDVKRALEKKGITSFLCGAPYVIDWLV